MVRASVSLACLLLSSAALAGSGRSVSRGHSSPGGQCSESQRTKAMADSMVTRPPAQRSSHVLDPVARRASVRAVMRLALV